jgi:glycosyltransferase involved in cell wall biosynthesis
VKHLFIADMFYPSVAVMLARSLRAVLSTRHRVVLMASSPPFSVAVVGAIVKRLFPHRVFLFVDMRDAWALHPALGPQTAVRRCIERFVFRQADERVTVSRGLANEFERAHGTPVRICYNVATHYDQVQVPIDVRLVDVFEGIRPTALSVVYTGSTPAGFYDTETFVAAFKELQSRSPDLALRLQFMFVGACEEVRLEVERQSAEAGAFHFREHLPTRFAVAAQSQANAVLFFGFNGDGNMGVVSTKFFEYLALGKPILPVGIRAGSDVDLLLEAACGRSIRARTRDELVRLLERVCREGVDCLPSLKDRRALDLLRDEYKRAVSHAIGR